MGRNARIGLFLLMGLVVALARLVEVEVGKARPQDEPPPVPLAIRKPKPVVSTHPRRARHSAPVARPATPVAPEPASAQAVVAADAEWPNGPVYVVKKGETLGTIAQKVLGTSKLANKLYEANADRIPSPTAMKAGTKLVIPKAGE
jgi:nucleoid-associated protein YgaU